MRLELIDLPRPLRRIYFAWQARRRRKAMIEERKRSLAFSQPIDARLIRIHMHNATPLRRRRRS